MENISKPGYYTFDAGAYRFKARPRPMVLRMAPYIRTNEEDEESTHAMLLLFVPWPAEGEQSLLRGSENAVTAFQTLKRAEKLPDYVLSQIERYKKSEDVINDTGDIVYNVDNAEADDVEDGNSGCEDGDGSVDDDGELDDEQGYDVDDLGDEMQDITVEGDDCNDTEEMDVCTTSTSDNTNVNGAPLHYIF